VGNPYELTGGEFYVDPDTQAAHWAAAELAAGRLTRTRWVVDQYIAKVPQFRWVGYGDLEGQLSGYLAGARRNNELAQISLYGIPNRDAGGPSSGGAPNLREYIKWVNQLVSIVSLSPSVIIVETDTIIHMSGLNSAQKEERLACLNYAVHAIREGCPNSFVYLDGGDGRWNKAADVAPWLVKAGVAGARGFSINVANFNTSSSIDAFSIELNTELGKWGISPKHYIIDTSRNGKGPDEQGTWCNPAGRKLGAQPIALAAGACDAKVWAKHPGESDGPCGAAPGSYSGQFIPQLAVNLYDGK
jgi:endoglucanase